jgi:hypothetical protein
MVALSCVSGRDVSPVWASASPTVCSRATRVAPVSYRAAGSGVGFFEGQELDRPDLASPRPAPRGDRLDDELDRIAVVPVHGERVRLG